jgi:predicted TIM-barrel fold metal-dependent hydrolase
VNFPFSIIDPHIHLWDLLRTPRELSLPRRLLGWFPWLYETTLRLGAASRDRDFVGRVDHVAWDYLPSQYAADASALPIREVVHVEASWHDHSRLAAADETKWLETLFDQETSPRLAGIVAYADLASPHLKALLESHRAASDRLCGIRQILAFDPDPGIRRFCKRPKLSVDPVWRRGLEELQPLGVCFDAWVLHPQLGEVSKLAREYPDQHFVLNHMGTPVGLGGPFASYGRSPKERHVILNQWQEGMAQLAEFANVSVKLSGFFMPIVGWGYERRRQPPSAQELLDVFAPACGFVLERFGVDRCLFASNFPMDKVSLSLQSLYELYAAAVAGLPLEDQRKLFEKNAQRIYRLR